MADHATQTFRSTCEDDTIALARNIAAALNGGEYISLEGDLGAGKTFFARALIHALGVTENVTSPTFVLQKIYALPESSCSGAGCPCHIAHYDFYRIGNYHELLDLGFEDHGNGTIVLAEWGNLFIDDFPVTPIRIHFETQPDDSRLIALSGLAFSV